MDPDPVEVVNSSKIDDSVVGACRKAASACWTVPEGVVGQGRTVESIPQRTRGLVLQSVGVAGAVIVSRPLCVIHLVEHQAVRLPEVLDIIVHGWCNKVMIPAPVTELDSPLEDALSSLHRRVRTLHVNLQGPTLTMKREIVSVDCQFGTTSRDWIPGEHIQLMSSQRCINTIDDSVDMEG